jgi:hypothetical protein
MTTGNTTLLGLALPVEGELDGTWGDVVNQSITELVDSAVAGTTTLSADVDVTLTTTALAANQARQAVILWTASNGASTRNITAPARSKPYIVINAGTGSIVLRGAGPTTGVTIIAGEKCLAAWNGSDFVKVSTSNTTSGTVTSVDVSGGTTGLTTTGGPVTSSGTITLAGTLAVANGGTGVTTSTGTGNVVLSDSPTLVTPALGTPASGNLSNATADGTNAVGYRNIPAVADKTTAYTLAVGDVGKVVGVGTGGSIEIPDTTFAAGDAVLIFNNTTGDITVTCTITTAYIAGTDTDVASVTLATRGVCNILFISGTVCVITGNIS